MIRFHQLFGAHSGRVVTLDQPVVRFGRLPASDVAFDPMADIDASAKHAEVRREGGAYLVVDVGSRNGTLVNGKRISSQILKDGDEIEFGEGGPRIRIEILSDKPTIDMPASIPPPAGPPGVAPTPPLGTPHPAGHATELAWSPFSPQPTPLPPFAAPPPPSFRPPPADFAAVTPSPSAGPSRGAAATAAPAKLYGQRTAAMMVQQALEQARQRPSGPSPGWKIALALVTLLLLAAVATILGLIFFTHDETGSARDEVARVQAELGQTAAPAVFLLVGTSPGAARRPLCTAFAVRPDLLATNAHCVIAMERQAGAAGTTFEALQDGSPARYPVTRMWRHPAYDEAAGHPTADAGLVQIGGSVGAVARLATMDELATLRPGDDVYAFGFPGDVPGGSPPVATVTHAAIGRMTAFDGSAAQFEAQQLLSRSAFAAPGTSGSPVYDGRGIVVGIDSGSHGVRIDLLLQLLLGLGR